MRKLTLVAVALVLLLPQMAQAWNATGHMVVAAIAYRELTEEAKHKVDVVLAAHPGYAKWRSEWKAESGVPQGLYIFMRASTWPDEIRKEKTGYNHPAWHYVDYPLVPPAFAMKPRPQPTDDLVYALDFSDAKVTAPATSPVERAVYLSWLIHATGDIAQPEHCATLVSKAFPYGDRGGNWFYVKTPDHEPFKLHEFWDELLGTSNKPTSILDIARRLESDPALARSFLGELAKNDTPTAWSLESRKAAIDLVYLRGGLRAAPAVFALDPRTRQPVLKRVDEAKAPLLPDNYQSDAISVARRSIALAGHRLHDELTVAARRWVLARPTPEVTPATTVAPPAVSDAPKGVSAAAPATGADDWQWYNVALAAEGKQIWGTLVVEIRDRTTQRLLRAFRGSVSYDGGMPYTSLLFRERPATEAHNIFWLQDGHSTPSPTYDVHQDP
jgi:hypothetical protein